MLRTNSKKAREHVREYIRQHADDIAEYTETVTTQSSDAEICAAVYQEFMRVCSHELKRGANIQEAFIDWASGLPLGGLFIYYYNTPAVDVLGDILEETSAERERFSEAAAEHMLSYLIFSECTKAAEKLNLR